MEIIGEIFILSSITLTGVIVHYFMHYKVGEDQFLKHLYEYFTPEVLLILLGIMFQLLLIRCLHFYSFDKILNLFSIVVLFAVLTTIYRHGVEIGFRKHAESYG